MTIKSIAMPGMARSALALALATPAFPGAAQQVLLEEIIVTAQKREQSLQNVPISIAAFDQESLQRRGITTLVDLQNQVPNCS